MAIPFQSTLNTYIAEGIRNATGRKSSYKVLSGGTMPDLVVAQIVFLIQAGIQINEQSSTLQLPYDTYRQIADLISPYTPGLEGQELIQQLQTSSIFGALGTVGNAPNVAAIIGDTVNSFINAYHRKVAEELGSIDAVLGSFGIGGSLGQIAEAITGNVIKTVTDSLSPVLSPLELSKVSPRAVGTILKGNGVVNTSDFGPSFDRIKTYPEIVPIITHAGTPTGDGNVDLNLTSFTNGQRDTFASGYVKAASGTSNSIGELSSLMENTRGTIGGTIDDNEVLPGPNPYPIDADTIDAQGSFVSSVEELEAEIASITRPIAEVIVHWSETFTNSNLSAAQLTDLTGAGDNAYHFIIRRDGSLERGVPLNAIGDHCSLNGHNEHSLGVCLVGGLNVATGAENLYEVASSRSITRSQYNTLYQLFRIFFQIFPGGQALGHMDIDPNMEDPGFDVRDYVYNNFNKQSLYIDPTTENALTPADILARLESSGESVVLEKDPDTLERNF
jgi:N-acetylmuramoyl-L-alanine amidase